MSLEQRLDRFFAPGGTLAQAHPGYESRKVQQDLAREVLRVLVEGGHLVAEAGTGVGKTLAYLVPALLTGRRVIVSTRTLALQDQLGRKDVPFLSERCDMPVRACTLKGRANYLCLHRFDAFRQAPTFVDRAEAAAWPSVERWAAETTVGDVAELEDLPESPGFWGDINARNETCLGSRCPRLADCHLQAVRADAHAAQLVIVNHHLFLADAVVRSSQFGEILPDAGIVIFDEAHRLEEAATSFFGRTVSNWRLRELADDTVRELARAGADSDALQVRARRLAEVASAFAAPWGPTSGRRPLGARLTPAQRDGLAAARAAVEELRKALAVQAGTTAVTEPLARRCRELAADLGLLSEREDAGWVYWYEVRGRGVFLTATPLDVSALLREHVFSHLHASVLTSATLAIDGSMEHVCARLGLTGPGPDGEEPPKVREWVGASPFDHATRGLLYLPPAMPEPRAPEHAIACAEHCRELLRASRGRAFLLFTSYGNLRKVHEILAEEIDHPILVQGDAPKHELLRRFREQEGAVLFATSSFWEGVDVPGEELSLVVIDKLPFAVPSDPVVAARSRLIEDAGGNPFRELSLPEAVLTLKQGAGRLLRSARDRGVVAILDPRVKSARYGRVFLQNLPPFRRTSSIEAVRRFFEGGESD